MWSGGKRIDHHIRAAWSAFSVLNTCARVLEYILCFATFIASFNAASSSNPNAGTNTIFLNTSRLGCSRRVDPGERIAFDMKSSFVHMLHNEHLVPQRKIPVAVRQKEIGILVL